MSDALYEHRFWLQILGDHCRFIFTALSPKEKGDVATAERLINRFDTLLDEARRSDASTNISNLTYEANRATEELRNFKLYLLERQLKGKVDILLTPSFINHMVNELEEYQRILIALLEGQGVPVFHPLHYDMLWLQDAYGHAASLAADLDFAEMQLIEKSNTFQNNFKGFYLKSVEMAGYLRTHLKDFPALTKFHADIDLEMKVFMHFLAELEELELRGEVLDRINPLMPDHMYREECYYLSKLAALGEIQSPNCDPTKPRVSN
ncbi:DUF2935 domain-containing protein [Paenibacillus sp. PDC88]|uniref:DUF2935 domain-containing protein n=1 Tax=Paenibacillus sp. PDC88 TaxID=1884375 RepID=UPI00089708FF|nr:DUF2935 domain-containing protein [Paenibacillus sp. PDC88]SDW71310.1 protein of unknown function [Paenibacillus sp. PDC88]